MSNSIFASPEEERETHAAAERTRARQAQRIAYHNRRCGAFHRGIDATLARLAADTGFTAPSPSLSVPASLCPSTTEHPLLYSEQLAQGQAVRDELLRALHRERHPNETAAAVAQIYAPHSNIEISKTLEDHRANLANLRAAALAALAAEIPDLLVPTDPTLIVNLRAHTTVLAWRPNPQGLRIHGHGQIGKSHALAHLACDLIRAGFSIVWRECRELCEAARDAAGDGSASKLALSLRTPDVLILDEFGKGRFTTAADNTLADAIHKRIDHRLPTLISTQYTLSEIAGFFTDKKVAEEVVERMRKEKNFALVNFDEGRNQQ